MKFKVLLSGIICLPPFLPKMAQGAVTFRLPLTPRIFVSQM